MNFRKLTIINSLIAIVSAATGSISAFSRYPGMVELIQANTKNYKANFKNTFVDGPIYSGDGTAYGNANSGGNCLFPKEEYYNDMMYAALNNKQYNLDFGCGLCALVVSTSHPYKPIRVRILDQCPECEHGSLDFSDKAFKALSNRHPDRIKITWALIPCDIDVNEYPALVKPNSPIKFQFKNGSTQFWGEVQVFNTRYPIAKVEFLSNGNYVTLNRRPYNYWSLTTGGFGAGPYTFRVTLADSTVIVAKNIKMVIPGFDEGADFSSGTQTIIRKGSTSTYGSSSGGSSNSINRGGNPVNRNVNTTRRATVRRTTIARRTTAARRKTVARRVTTTRRTNNNNRSSASNNCPAGIIRRGYSCCAVNNCKVRYRDHSGDWGLTSNRKWCGIRYSCNNRKSNNRSSAAASKSTCPKKFGQMGYKCCNSCRVVSVDKNGRWGVENGRWCGIRSNCK